MTLKKFLFCTFLFFLSIPITWATKKERPKKPQAQTSFKPYMLDHIHEGCPTNSSCPSQTGRRYQQWANILKETKNQRAKRWALLNQFRQKYGIPLKIWTFPKGEKTEGLIHWDSSCPNHNQKKEEKILIGLALAKDFKQVEKLEGQKVHIPRAFLLESNGKIREYKVPRGIRPLYIKGNFLFYTEETEGIYYGLRIGEQGDLKVVDPLIPRYYPQSVSCPQQLKERFSQYIPPKRLYQGMDCQSLWNEKAKKHQTMIFGWSCH